jgi:hypothetical protein
MFQMKRGLGLTRLWFSEIFAKRLAELQHPILHYILLSSIIIDSSSSRNVLLTQFSQIVVIKDYKSSSLLN